MGPGVLKKMCGLGLRLGLTRKVQYPPLPYLLQEMLVQMAVSGMGAASLRLGLRPEKELRFLLLHKH